MDSINRDCIFENIYLGRMILRNMNRRVEEMKKGTVCRVVCRRTSAHESMCSIWPFVIYGRYIPANDEITGKITAKNKLS